LQEFSESDGWNSDGSSADTAAFNKMPYKDFAFMDAAGNEYEPYEPKKNPKQGRYKWFWEPLLEADGKGYFTRQQHVTPYCGFTGRLLGMDDEDYKAFSSPDPQYDYVLGAEYVLSQTNTMATSDEQKMAVEFFDSKFTSLLPLQIGWSLRSGLTEFEFWHYDMTLVNVMYDATMLVWRDKVLWDRVRPTTVVHGIKGQEETMTFAGPGEGSNMVKGVDWQPYIRTMPHAEYPSGSSCICTAYAEALELLTGSDDIDMPLEQVFAPGSSRLEPGITPTSEVKLTFEKWSEVAAECGGSRLYGGMHFEQSVPAGNALCTGMAALVVDRALKLKEGDETGAIADFDDRSIHVKTKKYVTVSSVPGNRRHGGSF
jgi:hypothetical protein